MLRDRNAPKECELIKRHRVVAVLIACVLAVATLCAQQFGDQLARRLCIGSALSTCNTVRQGAGTPESSVTGLVGDLYLRTNGSEGTTLYVKESGSSTTGWVASNAIKAKTVALTDAQIKALPTTPITIVAAPGSAKVIQPIFVNLFAKTTAGAYTNINAAGSLTMGMATLSNMSYVPNDAAMTSSGSHTRLTDLLGGANNRRTELMPYFDTEDVDAYGPVGTVNGSSGGVNEALRISIDNSGSGALTGGNAANSLTVVVLYSVVDVP